jgi:hypothetical protein
MLKPSLALPSAAAIVAVHPTVLAFVSVVVATVLVLVLVAVIQLVPLLQAPLPVLGRRTWRFVLALAAVKPKKVDVVTFHLQFCLGPLFHPFYSYEHNTVALHMPLTSIILHPNLCWLVVLIDGSGHASVLPLEPHHLRLVPEKTIFGVHLLLLHLKHHVVPGDNMSTALAVICFHDFCIGFFIKGPCADYTKEQEQKAILSHSHLVLTFLHCAIHVDCHVSVVVRATGIVGDREGVSAFTEELEIESGLAAEGGILFSLFFPLGFLAVESLQLWASLQVAWLLCCGCR